MIFAAFALIAGAAATSRAERVLPPLAPGFHTSLPPGATASAAGILWLGGLNALAADRVAIKRNNEVGTLKVPLAVTKRPAVAAGKSGGKGGN
jgi:hypothetical protein